MKKLSAISALLAMACMLPAAHAGDAAAGEAKSKVCAGCHGVDGNSTNSILRHSPVPVLMIPCTPASTGTPSIGSW